jgi:hypothetical protein
MIRAVTVAGRVDRHHGEAALGHETARSVHEVRDLLVLAAAMPQGDQGARPAGTVGRPQHAGKVAEEEDLFEDAVGHLLGGEAQGPLPLIVVPRPDSHTFSHRSIVAAGPGERGK